MTYEVKITLEISDDNKETLKLHSDVNKESTLNMLHAAIISVENYEEDSYVSSGLTS